MMSRMHERYRKEVVPALMKRFARTNPMAVPKVSKVVVNIGLGEASQNVTLRGERMYEFLDRLCNVVLPRVRDFKGLPNNSFDGRGNYTMGLRDQLVFPEIDYTRVDKIKGMNITVTTPAKNDEEGRELLKLLGVPLRG
jgi:large subunit ribosomal protein L5